MPSETPIQTFYNNAHIFITGGTGFLGKVLLEKLLYSCQGVTKIYLLVRAKKAKDEKTRLKEMLEEVVFERLRKCQPNFSSKIRLIEGDCALPGLGISPQDRLLLLENTTVVFHCAATVRFDENLKIACSINVNGTQEIINLCKNMKNLKALVHVSTAYSNCNQLEIEEKFYEPPACSRRVIDIASVLTENEIAKITPELLEDWPNSYTFTKALAENLIKEEDGNLPACVFRPAIVTSSYKEPLPGWIDNLYGPNGLALAVGNGVIHVILLDVMAPANIVPVDLTVNAMIIAASETHKAFMDGNSKIKIFNFESSTDKKLLWKDYSYLAELEGFKVPLEKAIWYGSVTYTNCFAIYWFLSFFLHFLPAYIMDLGAQVLGKQPQMVKACRKISKFMISMNCFHKHFKFANDNVRNLLCSMSEEDKEIFNMDIKTLDWHSYLKSFVLGARLYLAKEPLDNLPQARKKWRRLYWIHQFTKVLFLLSASAIVYYAYLLLFSTT